jgi:diaminopimelate epimerase
LIPFTKAHACGNDFLIVTEEAAHGCNWADLTRRLCARNTGLGADGVEFF